MKDEITLDGEVYVRKDTVQKPALDAWQKGKVDAAWEEVRRQEKAARRASEKWHRDNPCAIVNSLIKSHYDGRDEDFDAHVESFLRWYENHYPDSPYYVEEIRTILKEGAK